ncbi:energy transducer TonB [Gluconobacter morbifer]|uniref:Lipoprotein n=1 Tax=Gluconobacter morbifer G707 TaxID=1088869 RepID=G6XMH6_9PROT|nr:hypothetical protein [Gluconobacter morbifer]EHH67074.1 hypothetical protein GMO_26940 [Gluconobacter morbifer G707]
MKNSLSILLAAAFVAGCVSIHARNVSASPGQDVTADCTITPQGRTADCRIMGGTGPALVRETLD